MRISGTILPTMFLFLVLPMNMRAHAPFNPDALGGWAISADLFVYILDHLEPGKTILELGSGSGTGELANYYSMYSIEHDPSWLGKYKTTYIYAPIKNYLEYRWYDLDVVSKELPENYDLILVDGPTGIIGRIGFLKNLNLFKTNVCMIFDDVQRSAEFSLLKMVSSRLNRQYSVIKCSDGKAFGVILPA